MPLPQPSLCVKWKECWHLAALLWFWIAVSFFTPIMTACFCIEKSVNAWPALADRLHTSVVKLNPHFNFYRGRQ
jgi:hypothetical protein